MILPKIKEKNNIIKSMLWVLFFVLMASMLFRNASSYLDPDLGWHLAAGQEVTQTADVPHINHYNYTIKDARWVDHEWLSDYLSFQVYHNAGYIYLILIFTLIALLTLVLIWKYAKLRSAFKLSTLSTIAILYIGMRASLPHLGVRIQELSIVALALLLIILDTFFRKKNWRYLLILPPFFYLWSCLHGGFMIGFAVIFFYIVLEIARRSFAKCKIQIIDKYIKPENLVSWKNISILSITLFLSFFATLFTPYRTELYSFLAGYRDSYYLTHIQEWMPQWYFPFQYWQLAFIALVLSAIIISIVMIRNGSKHYRLRYLDLGLSFVFVALALKSTRHFPLLFVVSTPLILNFFHSIYLELGSVKTKFHSRCQKFCHHFIVFVFIIAALFFTTKNIQKTDIIKDPFRSFCTSYPCEALEYLRAEKNAKSGNLFAEYDWGGYLIWTYPERLLFIDGRLPQFPYRDHTMLEEYADIRSGDRAQSIIAEHNISTIMLHNKQKYIYLNWLEKYYFRLDEAIINNNPDNLKEYLESSSDWSVDYQDDTTIIYVQQN